MLRIVRKQLCHGFDIRIRRIHAEMIALFISPRYLGKIRMRSRAGFVYSLYDLCHFLIGKMLSLGRSLAATLDLRRHISIYEQLQWVIVTQNYIGIASNDNAIVMRCHLRYNSLLLRYYFLRSMMNG